MPSAFPNRSPAAGPALATAVAAWIVLAASAPAAPLTAQDPVPGLRVVLVERDLDIPAHPAPRDNRVPFRFASGSLAHILARDDASGWLQISGEQVGGEPGVGWIVPDYVAGPAPDDAGPSTEPPPFPWCPAKGSPAENPFGRLRIATWNMGNLHAVDGASTFIGSDPSVKRFPVDYERIRCYVRMFDPDVLAVQEVDGEEALRRVVDPDVYEVHVSSRPRPSFMGGRQNTGFAYKRGLDVVERPDVVALDVSDGFLRRGARIDVTVNGRTLRLMSVHLKSGCFHNGMGGSSCTTLFAQVPVLESWIDAAAVDPDPFVVLGDFNRRLNQAGDLVWVDLDDGDPGNADLTAVTENRAISCRDNQFTEFIDHIVADPRALALVERASFRHVEFRQDDRPVWDRISDHCPVVVEMWLPG